MHLRRLRDRLALLLAAAPGAGGLTAAPTATAAADDPVGIHGLKGEYYTQSAPGAFDFDRLKATGFDPNLDFDNLVPRLAFTTGQSDDVSVRWTGKIVPERTGPHTFSITGDNGFRLWIDGKLVIDHWVDDRDREQTGAPVELTAGRAYDIKVEYFEHYGGSHLHLRWTRPGGSKEAVAQSAFRLPDGWAYDGATAATVTGTGRTLKLDFPQRLDAPPAALTDHLEAVIGGAKWPLVSAKLDPDDPSALLVAIGEPVVGNKTGTARGTADVRYDGNGGLTTADGNVVKEFWSGDIMDEHGYPSPALPPHPDGRRALVSGEYGGLGLAMPGHAWSVQHSYVDVDAAAYTDDYLAKLAEVHALACPGSNGAVYTQISDVEGELNGLLTYDHKVLKPNAQRVRTAQQALIRDASQAAPAGCPTP